MDKTDLSFADNPNPKFINFELENDTIVTNIDDISMTLSQGIMTCLILLTI